MTNRWRNAFIGAFAFLLAEIAMTWGISTLVTNQARYQAQKAFHKSEIDSAERSIATCRRTNTQRAYFILRAEEFTKTTNRKPSFTTGISPQVFAILDCADTIAEDGRPVPLKHSLQSEYLRLYKEGRVALTRHQRIIGSVPFDVYFSGKSQP